MKVLIRCGLVIATLTGSSVLATSCFAKGSTLTVRKSSPYRVGYRSGYKSGFGLGYAAGTVAPYKMPAH